MSKEAVLQGDCLEQMRTLPDNSVDTIITDPPYGLSFMGRSGIMMSLQLIFGRSV